MTAPDAPTPANNFTLTDPVLTRIAEAIARGESNGDILRLTGVSVAIIAAIRADYERMVAS